MAVPAADPQALELDQAFQAAMEGPAKPRSEAKAPPEVDHDAPHGRDEAGVPLAPFGLTKEGKPKRTAGGRPLKDSADRSRTVSAQPSPPPVPPAGQKAKPDPRNWTEELDGLGDALWFGLSAVSKVAPSVPILGKLIPEEKLAAQAFVLSETKPRLVAAVNLAAQHNAKAAGFCKKLEGGDGLWALTAMFMVMPVLSLSVTIWKGDETELKEAELPTLAEMAKRNEDKMDEMLARINAQIAAATEAAMPATEAAG